MSNSARRPLVLLVDDHADSLEMLGAFLTANGFETCETNAATNAIEMAVTRRPDVIVTDVSMPHVDGWALLRTLRVHPLTAHIPVVMLTGHVDAQTRMRAERTGCTAFLTKPCDPWTVVDTLRGTLPRLEAEEPQPLLAR